MLLDLHIEGSAPVTLLVRDESRSTRSTSGNMEDEKSIGNSEEHLISADTKPKRKKHTQQGDRNVAEDSSDNLLLDQEKQKRARKRNHSRRHTSEIPKPDFHTGETGNSISSSSSKSSLFLDSFHSDPEREVGVHSSKRTPPTSNSP